jgi:acetolactate synthase-1/2/3 large subunit
MTTSETVRTTGPERVGFADAAAELVWTLADEGVTHVFFNPGTDTAPVQEALARARSDGTPHPRSVLCIHEQVALSAAIGHAFLSREPQAVMVHVDAGTLNLGGSLHQAQRNRSPVVVFAGRTPYSIAADVPGHRDTPIHWPQEQPDQAAAMRAYGKWTMEVPRGRELGALVRRAYQVVRTDPKGPAYVMLPRETLMEAGGAGARRLVTPRPSAPDPGGLAEAARILADAQRPVILTSRTGQDIGAAQALVRVAELLGCPVVDQRDRVSIPPRHPLCAGEGTDVLREADVILLLDVEVPWIPAVFTPGPATRVIQIDADCLKASMPSWTYPVDLALTAHTAIALPLLVDEIRGLADEARAGRWRERRPEVERRVAGIQARWDELAASGEAANRADAMLAALSRALPDEAVVVEEAVTNRGAVLRQVVRGPDRFLAAGAPALGAALGGALGARLARPEAPVVAVVGDGAFNFGVPTAALFSAHRAGAPFVAVILDNGAYRASQYPVARLYPEGVAATQRDYPETELSPAPDYALLARACGGHGEVVARPEEMGPAVERCLDQLTQGRCSVIDVKLPA